MKGFACRSLVLWRQLHDILAEGFLLYDSGDLLACLGIYKLKHVNKLHSVKCQLTWFKPFLFSSFLSQCFVLARREKLSMFFVTVMNMVVH